MSLPAELTDAARGIPLFARDGTIRAFTMVDYETVSGVRWRLTAERYVARTVREGGRFVSLYLHRVIMGVAGAGRQVEVDHINRDPLDNRRSNLRIVTRQQNAQNQPSRVASSSRFRGVYWKADSSGWAAQVWIEGRNRWLGTFPTEEAAADAAAAARREVMPFSYETRVAA